MNPPGALLDLPAAPAIGGREIHSRQPAHTPATVRYVVVGISGRRFCIPAAAVSRVVTSQPVTPVPGASADVLGIAAVDGDVAVVLDPRAFLDISDEVFPAIPHLVVLRLPVSGEAGFALAVEQLFEVVDLPLTASGEAGPNGMGDGYEVITPERIARVIGLPEKAT
jgi:chemotaxis signal transduction protein